MATDNFCEMNESDGEDIVYGDISDISKFASARFRDQFFAKLFPYVPQQNIGTQTGDPKFPGEYGASAGIQAVAQARAIAISIGSAYPWVNNPDTGDGYISGAATLGKNVVGIAPGTLLQFVGDDSFGLDSSLLAYTFAGTETVAIAAGDPSHPRVDLIEMQLQYILTDSQSRDFQDAVTGANSSQPLNKKRRVQLTLQVKQGTPAASPVTPSPDTGFCAIAQVYVPTGYATTTQIKPAQLDNGSSAILMDDRMPIVQRSYRVDGGNMFFAGTDWTRNADGAFVTAAAASKTLWVLCPASNGRLIGIDFHGNFATGSPTAELYRKTPSADTAITSGLGAHLITTNAGDFLEQALLDSIARVMPASGTVGGSRSTGTDGLCVPVWASGCQAPVRRHERGALLLPAQVNSTGERLAIKIVSGGGDTVYDITFHFAEGL